jgi:UDP-4-amino-4-deoxy-L-arabinose-oxoglutarate aminotransferase
MPKVEFYRHALNEQDIEAVVEALEGLFLTTGPRTAEFEARLAGYLGVEHVVGTSSCTAAMCLSLIALDIGQGDEVITTPMTFIATPNAVLHAGATPVFVDVEPVTGNIDLDEVEQAVTEKTKAVMPVHLYGQMADMGGLCRLCDDRGLRLIEDAAHALEAQRDGIGPGQRSDTACFSFYATKNLTSGEGGAVATGDAALAERLHRLRMHGMSRSAADRYHDRYQHWDMVELGYKMNLFDIQAALLISQLPRLAEQLERRERICRRYERAFAGIDGLDFPRVVSGSRSGRHLFTIWVPRGKRDDTLLALQEKQIGVAVNYRPVHLLSYYRERFGHEPGEFPVAEDIGNRTVTLPLYTGMSDGQVQTVIDAVREVASTW